MRSSKFCVITAMAALFAGWPFTAHSEEVFDAKRLITPDLISDVNKWLKSPIVSISVNAQNERYAALSQAEVEQLDIQWREERTSTDQPLVAAILSNPLSTYLTQIQAKSDGLYTEMFIMDSQGLNVGQSAITSDFWQGDEAKFQNTYPKGADIVFIDDAEFHEGSGTWRAQANITISENQKPIGAITVEFNLTEIYRRNAAS